MNKLALLLAICASAMIAQPAMAQKKAPAAKPKTAATAKPAPKAKTAKTKDGYTVLQNYFAKNNIKAQKTQSGLYYTIQKEGSGELPAKGQTVSVMYTGKLLDGTTFDSNVGKDAMKVRVGGMSTIPGFDEGLMLLKKGSKATLFMPSVLAYGSHATGPIPADACLIFEVEVTDIK